MNILITGANGQLGNALKRTLNTTNWNCKFTDTDALDLTDKKAIETSIQTFKPHVVINCAAFTAVDKAEEAKDLAFAVNRDAVKNLAQAIEKIKGSLIHISSDYVYHNQQNRPLLETDDFEPKSVYAQSKLEGDHAALANCSKTTILRTSWVYGLDGHNFVRTMVKLGKSRPKLTVVYDQIGAPTFADDIALAINTVIKKEQEKNWNYGVYNFAGEGVCSWYDFAKEIMTQNQLPCDIQPIVSAQYPTPAPRPNYSVLNLQKARDAGLPLRHWKDAYIDFCTKDATR